MKARMAAWVERDMSAGKSLFLSRPGRQDRGKSRLFLRCLVTVLPQSLPEAAFLELQVPFGVSKTTQSLVSNWLTSPPSL